MNGQGWWYATRATGILAWALFGASAALGMVQAGRTTRGRTPAWIIDLHRGVSGLGCFALAGHLVALLADAFAAFEVPDLLVPMRSPVDPGGVAWGIAAMYLVVAVEVTSLAMRRISRRTWRRVHGLGLGVFWLATLHAVITGTDLANPFAEVAGIAGVATVGWLSVARLRSLGPRPSEVPADVPGAEVPTAATG